MKFSLNKETRKKLDELRNDGLAAQVAVRGAALHFRKGDPRNIDPEIQAGIDTILAEDERMRRSEKSKK